MRRIMVTGGLGFLGSYFVEQALDRGDTVINIDKRTQAARRDLDFDRHARYEEVDADLCQLEHLPVSLDIVVNFAAEAHDDNQVLANQNFFYSNVRGVHRLLELVRAKDATDRPVFVHISSTEVYGSIVAGASGEQDTLNPANPYAASKAAADQLVMGWARTYALPMNICRICNAYGYGQHTEKLLPKTLLNLARGRPMTIHGEGEHRRQWIYAGDAAQAVMTVLEKGAPGRIYNVCDGEDYSILEAASLAAKAMGRDPEECFVFVAGRHNSGLRYAADGSALRALGWAPTMTLPKYLPEYIRRLL